MYKIRHEGKEIEAADLDEAMKIAKAIGHFVTISGNGYEIVGKFGVDQISGGKCPDGIQYTWMKRRSQ